MDARSERGKLIAETFGQVKRLDETTYKVRSQTSNAIYEVISTETGWVCNCPDFRFRGLTCKHIYAVKFSFEIRKEVQAERIIEPVSVESCLSCGSQRLKRFGVRHNKAGDIQRFMCLNCGKTFSLNIGFEKMKHNPQAITTAMQLYFSGESLRKTAESLRLLGADVSYKTIERWIAKYVSLMDAYVQKIRPNVGGAWRADEIFVKFSGERKYVYALMDDETRFWIAQQVGNTKYVEDIRPLFAEGRETAGKVPKVLITDGAPNFHNAYLKEYYTHFKDSPKHVADIRLGGKVHNNKMERMNGEIRDREKVMRGLKVMDTPILQGVQLYHNFIKPHEALNGETPAEKAGIKVKGANKWMTLIQNASLPQ